MSLDANVEKLPSAPLQEVVFELLWELGQDEHGTPDDRGFDLALGIFAEIVGGNLPFIARKVLHGVPAGQSRLFPIPFHQFWKAENCWPVVQIGPGILVINDIEANYAWNGFKTITTHTINALLKAYKTELKFISIRLKYINAYDIGKYDGLAFMNKNFNISLHNDLGQYNNPALFSFNQKFNLGESGNLDFQISSAVNASAKPAIIWQSVFSKDGSIYESEIDLWLEDAHTFLSDHFKSILKPHFYAKFTTQKN